MLRIAKLTRPLAEKFVLGASANRDELCKILSPKLGRDLPMTADARRKPVPLGKTDWRQQKNYDSQ